MDFELSQEQMMLKDSVERFVLDTYEVSNRKELAETTTGYSEANWAIFAEMGWLGVPFSETHGGFGGRAVDLCVIMEALGGGLVLEPFVASALLGGTMIEALGSEEQKAAVLPAIIAGEMKLALAYSEPASGFDLAFVETTATKGGGRYVLNGQKSVVLHAAGADRLVVIARTSGAAGDGSGVSAFLVQADAIGLRRQDYPMVDGGRASDIWLDNVEADLVGDEGQALVALEAANDLAICALCAEAVGAMRKVLEITKDYTASRNQFGKAIGDNQVIQHRLVDMFTNVEEAKAITDMAAMRIDGGGADASKTVAAAKAKVGEAARFVGAQGVQLHGGIGMTDEYPIGHYFKRLMAIDATFGDANHHLNRFAEQI